MKQFPACTHRTIHGRAAALWSWLAAEPFRLFFLSGAAWSILGVSLWPLYYWAKLGFYPSVAHARIMIECFAGAFVIGFLGTAAPRMASAPRLSVPELLALLALHSACGVLHLKSHTLAADRTFAALLISLLAALLVRIVAFRRDSLPPQLTLAFAGLLCGLAGTVLWLDPDLYNSPARLRLAALLLYHGFLLLPVLGIGAFLFPRLLGGDFSEPSTKAARRTSFLIATATTAIIVASFFLDILGNPILAGTLRASASATFLLVTVSWRRQPGDPPRHTMARNLVAALLTALTGIASAAAAGPRHIGLDHLLFIGGFGLLILIVASRVLCGHSGQLHSFSIPSAPARAISILALTAAATRASADFWPNITVSHHQYASLTWSAAVIVWLSWHRHRFFLRDPD
jgi:uncharacterized protein involved in response to NO